MREEILSAFIRLVCHTPELQTYTVQKLYLALLEDISQESLTLASTWLIGEFGDVLLQGWVAEEGEQPKNVTHSDIVDLLLSVLHSPYSNALSSQFVLTALVKLSARFSESPSSAASAQIERIEDILKTYETTQELELQQRSVEYGSLLRLTEVRGGVLERMPPPEIKATIMGTVSEKRSVGSTKTTRDTSTVLDLLGDDISSDAGTGSSSVNGSAPSSSAQQTQDLLADIFGSGPAAPSSSTSSAPAPAPTSAHADIMSLFGGASSTPSAAPAPASSSSMSGLDSLSFNSQPSAPPPKSAAPQAPAPPTAFTAYDKHGLRVTLTPRASPTQAGVIQILAKFTATESQTIEGVNFQAAVPRVRVSLPSSFLLSVNCTDVIEPSLSFCFLRPSSCRCSPCRTQTLRLVRKRLSRCE